MSPIELLAAITGILGVWLSARERVSNWPIGMVSVALYAVVFWQERLYANTGLQVVYFALSVYGWYEWLHGGAGHTELHISRTPRRVAWLLAGAGLVFSALVAIAFARWTDASHPVLDPLTVGASLVAEYMLTRKLLENWAVWFVVDLVYVGVFIADRMWLTTGLYLVFVWLAVVGHVRWSRALRAERPA